MNTFIEVLRWIVISASIIYVLFGAYVVGQKRKPVTMGDYVARAIFNIVIIYLLARGI